ncbi:26S proteasome non-ATPase regulatory subunit, putative [Perkinsus marinus ATCC 50983]|uniref:26S proteasome non-ATPase regulatory subunit, putative n=1 Tax=Perkinsus marinus (strain ATCC 50983 / TXsc) TaxID=423536 RepID=C5L0P6_PERM5|nr:26S proteasome non-ATPase regulatory subunit, putative [Perkinsus marinus ATCC 50983]EER09698.1 26S proteasome non-ATPase regulatory subunit, putative [Perkinsus marinus ATCC 50983]|eukprot:XP_002777903.1 26S proteasome non-ATPase regulatory subunit, putative [Perkinsus marinus ATCC 50983]
MMTVSSDDEAMAEIRHLMVRKDAIEKEIDQIWAVFNSSSAYQQVGRNGSLLDSEGFPRGDIDHYLITSSRQRLTRLENDLKEVMNSLEKGLESLHQIARDTGTITKGERSNNTSNGVSSSRRHINVPNDGVIMTSDHPFACVSEVAPGSPAAEAGLLDGDRIVDFGGAKRLGDLPSRVQTAASSDSSLFVEIQRPTLDGFRIVKVELRPREWSGRGLLGCLVTPL